MAHRVILQAVKQLEIPVKYCSIHRPLSYFRKLWNAILD